MRSPDEPQGLRRHAITITAGVVLLVACALVLAALRVLPGGPSSDESPSTSQPHRGERRASAVDGGRGDVVGPQGAVPFSRSYGARHTGPVAEGCQTIGRRISSTSMITEPGTYLLARGTYSELSVPEGTTVKPYDCADVLVTGRITLGDGSTLAGLTLRSEESYVLRIDGTEITVRNNVIEGGVIEAVRIRDGARDVRLIGNELDGGRDNHVVKVVHEDGGAHPDDIVVANNIFSKRYFDAPSEDLLQLDGHRHVVIERNTFASNLHGEDAIDIKQGVEGALIERNLFEGNAINDECLLVQGSYARNVVWYNVFLECSGISLGAHPEERLLPWWRFEGNWLVNSTLRLRRSEGAEIADTTMTGGVLKLGLASDDDFPRGLSMTGVVLDDVHVEDNVPVAYACRDMALRDTSGDALQCQ